MKRLPDWQPRLLAYVTQPREFSWPDGNCAAFVAAGVDAICEGTGYLDRMLSRFRSFCSGEQQTADFIRDNGGLEDLVDWFLDDEADKIPWGWARAGDVVLVRDGEDREVLGLCIGAQVVCATAQGVLPIRLSRAVAAWRIV